MKVKCVLITWVWRAWTKAAAMQVLGGVVSSSGVQHVGHGVQLAQGQTVWNKMKTSSKLSSHFSLIWNERIVYEIRSEISDSSNKCIGFLKGELISSNERWNNRALTKKSDSELPNENIATECTRTPNDVSGSSFSFGFNPDGSPCHVSKGRPKLREMSHRHLASSQNLPKAP